MRKGENGLRRVNFQVSPGSHNRYHGVYNRLRRPVAHRFTWIALQEDAFFNKHRKFSKGLQNITPNFKILFNKNPNLLITSRWPLFRQPFTFMVALGCWAPLEYFVPPSPLAGQISAPRNFTVPEHGRQTLKMSTFQYIGQAKNSTCCHQRIYSFLKLSNHLVRHLNLIINEVSVHLILLSIS